MELLAYEVGLLAVTALVVGGLWLARRPVTRWMHTGWRHDLIDANVRRREDSDELWSGLVHGVTRPLRRFDDDSPETAQRRPTSLVECPSCAGARVSACDDHSGNACGTCFGRGLVGCRGCGGTGVVEVAEDAA